MRSTGVRSQPIGCKCALLRLLPCAHIQGQQQHLLRCLTRLGVLPLNLVTNSEMLMFRAHYFLPCLLTMIQGGFVTSAVASLCREVVTAASTAAPCLLSRVPAALLHCLSMFVTAADMLTLLHVLFTFCHVCLHNTGRPPDFSGGITLPRSGDSSINSRPLTSRPHTCCTPRLCHRAHRCVDEVGLRSSFGGKTRQRGGACAVESGRMGRARS